MEEIGIRKMPQTKKDPKCEEEVIEQSSKEVRSCSVLVVRGCSLMCIELFGLKSEPCGERTTPISPTYLDQSYPEVESEVNTRHLGYLSM